MAAVKRHNRDWSGLKLWRRFAFGFCGLAIAATGVVALAAGRVYFQTTDFFIAFAPLAIIVGAFLVVFAFRLGPRD